MKWLWYVSTSSLVLYAYLWEAALSFLFLTVSDWLLTLGSLLLCCDIKHDTPPDAIADVYELVGLVTGKSKHKNKDIYNFCWVIARKRYSISISQTQNTMKTCNTTHAWWSIWSLQSIISIQSIDLQHICLTVITITAEWDLMEVRKPSSIRIPRLINDRIAN